MEFENTNARTPLSNTSNQQSDTEDNSLEDESEVADALILLSENVKIAQVVRNRRSKQSEAEEFILAALTLAKFSGRCKNYREREIRAVLGNTPDRSKALRKLVDDGKVKRSGKGGRLQPFTYSLA